MFNVYEVKGEKRWFLKCLGNDKFTAEVLYDHLLCDFLAHSHSTTLIMVQE